mmetsp:Transcript_38538/g.44873  ORF Transcript_38538/g.44873 Transcript_38538/m.44873 type:complete len:304 (-) Transcript_38538:131-1042(-)
MLTRPTRLEVKDEKLSTKWHSIRSRYVTLFDPLHVDHVERWYNTIAPNKHRENFRSVMKSVLQCESEVKGGIHGEANDLESSKVSNMIRIYGESLSPHGRALAHCWLLNHATPIQMDAFRDIFTGVCSLFTAESQTKHAFKYRQLPELPRRIGSESFPRADTAPTRGPAEGSKRAVEQINNTLSLDADDQIAALKAKRQLFLQSNKYQVDPQTGCSTFRAVTGSPRRELNSKKRVMATFQPDGTQNWISTTRDLIRNYGSKPLIEAERIRPEEHPAISLTTASVGLCVPSVPESFRRSLGRSK